VRIALLGGTFNPVHIGHLALADDVHISLGYDLVLLVPANIPPHKELSGGASSADRLEMLRLAASGVPFLGVDESRGKV
jgi:nicotinate-nucleotide adenylyltransferase